MWTGHCLCGSVRYEVSSFRLPLTYCHCEECRRGSGSSMNTTSLIREQDFRIVAGADEIRVYESSPGNRRHFCGSCGSPVFKTLAVAPGTLSLRMGTLDGDPGLPAAAHIWVSEKAPWVEIADDLPRFARGPKPPGESAD